MLALNGSIATGNNEGQHANINRLCIILFETSPIKLIILLLSYACCYVCMYAAALICAADDDVV
jgi:hypothetical protein